MAEGLTMAEHRAVAEHLKRARDCLVRAGIAVGNAYGERDLRVLARATEMIDQMRGRMEARLFVEWPGEASPSTYYPGGSLAESSGNLEGLR